MKTVLTTLAISACFLASAQAGPGHSGNHDDEMAVGSPGTASDVDRTVMVTMKETEDGRMVFEPSSLDVKRGETIQFDLENAGLLEHEFVLDLPAKNQEHKEMMMKFPEMEHDDPNSIRLQPGDSGEIIWTFSNAGRFEFACLIPGHYESGMHAAVHVSDDTASN